MSVQQGPIDLGLLRGTVAVVTGAVNGGIGYGLCERAAELGLHVALLDLNESVVQEASTRLTAAYPGVRVLGVTCDVTKPEQLAGAARTVQAGFGETRIGAVFANAGVAFFGGILRSSIQDWKATFEVNVVGVVNTIKAFVPLLMQSADPSIVCTTASIAGLVRGIDSMSAYSASKHAVVALTEALSFELSQKHPQIRVHVCCPCLVATRLLNTSREHYPSTKASTTSVEALTSEKDSLLMTPKRHAVQVWDRIEAGEFYMVCDNIRPYVDHDFPFDGATMIARRVDALLKSDFQRRIDNGGGFVGPLIKEAIRRRAHVPQSPREQAQGSKL